MIARVIVLNGVGSVGKTSTAKALQQVAATPLLRVSMDAFFDMVPGALIGHPDGVVFEVAERDGMPSVAIRSGPVVDRAMRGMRHAIAAMARQGSDLVVDDVMLDRGEADEYRELLAPFELRFVGLFAPLEVLERRERERGDRMIGLARWQFDRVHRGVRYDLEIDTAGAPPLECAERIKAAFGL